MAHAVAIALTAGVVLGVGAPGALAAAPLSWSSSAIAGAHGPTAVSCPGEELCVAVDGAGDVLTSTEPGSASPGWSAGAIDGGHALRAVSCASLALCVAVDDRGALFTSTSPGAGAGSWRGPTLVDEGRALSGVSCPSASLCVAVDEGGYVLASGTPGAAAWSAPARIDSASALRAISCASSSLCAAVDHAGNVLASAQPGEAGSWHARAIDASPALNGISCIPAGACVAVDGAGNALASADPGAGSPTWSSTQVDGAGLLAVSCASTGLCVALDGAGSAVASDNAASPLPAWSPSGAGGAPAGIACLASGLCVAVDSGGRELAGRVPAPAVTTTAPTEVRSTSATLAGVVNPNDAALTSCYFEYGPEASYGQIAPCASLPSPAGGAQEVSAPVSGLQPNTTYHYRLLASSASGARAGADQSFTTASSSEFTPLTAHPSIAGTPAVGSHLTCRTGLPSGSSARIAFAWLRDLLPISGVSSSSYVVRGIDAGHHLQCQVTTSNAGGTTSAKSSFVTIPTQGVPVSVGETAVSPARVRGATVGVVVVCSPQGAGGCHVALRLIARSHGKALTIAATSARLPRGSHRLLSLKLSASGRRLLARSHRLPALLTVSGTVIGAIEALLSQQRLTLGSSSHLASHRARARRR